MKKEQKIIKGGVKDELAGTIQNDKRNREILIPDPFTGHVVGTLQLWT